MYRSWFFRHRIWLIPAVFIFILGTGWFFISGMNKVVADLGFAYSETDLFDEALTRLNNSQEVVSVFGGIQQLDKMAILEGETIYSKTRDSIKSSFRIVGEKLKGRCDLHAYMANGTWQIYFLQVRTKPPQEIVKIVVTK